jgi:uncharacterized protein YfeS
MHAYRFQDEKSDKFWRLEQAGAALAVNHGKTGTIGKYQVKEFADAQACEKEARKLVAAKVAKGYAPFAGFDADRHRYFDHDEIGPHPLTSHPAFRAHFTDALYYDCGHEAAPFGSDEGSDTLMQIEEDMRKGKAVDFAAFPKKLVETYWDMRYLPPVDLSPEAVEHLARSDEMDLVQSDQVTYATAFAQIKITGRIDPALKSLALNAIRRLGMTAVILGWIPAGQPAKTAARMRHDLERFSGPA